MSGGQATITLDASNDGSFDVEILAIDDPEDEFESNAQECSIQASVDPAASNLATDGVPLTINVNIPQDPLTGTLMRR